MTSGSLSLGEAFCCGDHAEQGQGERCRLLPSRPSAFLRSDWTLGGPERTPVDPRAPQPQLQGRRGGSACLFPRTVKADLPTSFPVGFPAGSDG